MNTMGIPVQPPTAPSALPQVTLVQPGQARVGQGHNSGWAPARRAQPMMAQSINRPVRSALSGKQVGQGEAQLWARGSDITFSILTGLAAIVSGIGLIINFGKADPSKGAVVPSAIPGQPARFVAKENGKAKPVWYVVGAGVAIVGVVNIWASINRAAALHPTAPVVTTPAQTAAQ